MGIFDGVLLCVDFDDTLAVEGEVSAQNAAAIRYFTGNGGKFTIVSGRNIRFFIEKYPAYGTNAPLVGFNGARIYDPEKGAFIYEGGATGLDMFEFMRPFWEKDTRIRSLWVHSFAMRLWRLRRDVAPTAIDQAKARAALPLYNLICGTSAADSAAVRDALLAAANGRYAIARSHEEGVEIICRGDEKGDAVERLRAYCGARLVVGVGNYENDISMLRAADVGFAVANSCAEVLAAADRVTVSAREHAIAAVIDEIERELR